MDLGRIPPPLDVYRQAVETARTSLGERHPNYAASLNDLAGVYLMLGKYAEAEALYRQAMDIYRAALGENHAVLRRHPQPGGVVRCHGAGKGGAVPDGTALGPR
jgi:tetratricopeptide (TPR) repeat protein